MFLLRTNKFTTVAICVVAIVVATRHHVLHARDLIDRINAALEAAPDSMELYIARGRAWNARKEFDSAIKDYDMAIQLGAGPEVFGYRAATRVKLGETDAAIADFGKAIDGDESKWEYFAQRGSLYFQREELGKARADAAQALTLNPKWAYGHMMCGSIDLKNGEEELALAEFDAFMQLEPSNWRGYLFSAEIRSCSQNAHLRDGKVAVQHATKACILTRWTDDAALEVLARALAEVGRFEDAQLRLQEAIVLSPMKRAENRQRLMTEFKAGIPHRRSLKEATGIQK